MMDKIRTRSGRMVLAVVGILLTSTVGHTAARLMGTQMALGQSSFAFQLAVLIALALVATAAAAIQLRRPLAQAAKSGAAAPAAPTSMAQTRQLPALSGAQIAQLRMPPGVRLDSNESIMITTAGVERRILFVNPAFARLTGFEAADWIGRSGDLLQADGPLRMESLLWLDTEADGSEVHWIARLHRRDGTEFCAEAHLHPIARNGAPAHVVVVLTDVTSRVGAAKSTRPSAPQPGIALKVPA